MAMAERPPTPMANRPSCSDLREAPGLLRNIHNLTWCFAPLFDSGNSLWYDKDEGAVARGDHSFVSQPFDPTPNRQLLLASRTEWFDPRDLGAFVDEALEILAEGDLAR